MSHKPTTQNMNQEKPIVQEIEKYQFMLQLDYNDPELLEYAERMWYRKQEKNDHLIETLNKQNSGVDH
jgi:hypothetical protein